jgi:hypothetical protein
MSTYESDFYAWTQKTAELLKQCQFTELDLDALVEEIEDMGKSERRALESRLSVLLGHLLKWQYQPDGRSYSWQGTIDVQREAIAVENTNISPGTLRCVLSRRVARCPISKRRFASMT